MSRLFDVVVLGAGPAGAAAAMALAGKGFNTAVVSKGSATEGHGPSAALAGPVQGLSSRALVALTEAGLAPAARCASGPAARVVFWSGERSERGLEGLVEREVFDASLRSCLQGSSVSRVDAVARGITFAEELWQVETSEGPIQGRTVLDARGRHARRSDERGPLLVSWSLNLKSDECRTARTAVVALDDGWCWLAITPGGTLHAQFVTSARQQWSREQLARRIQDVAEKLPEAALPVDQLVARGSESACAAVARYSQPSRGPGHLRIGDAAVAMDPLSGNGIYEAVRSARVAAAAVNSYLQGLPWSVVARFVDGRSRELWRRCASKAAEFYRLQAGWSGSEFWTSTAAAYAVIRHEV
ncbi:MAG: FAD-dependent monooxygenase [Proteobacteria bacterium]|nr:FAD-dependent monooxygenase [Pseudomonadota bacterium]